MAEVRIDCNLSSALCEILNSEAIEPGSDVGYELCKLIWMYHPLGGKLVEKPIDMAMCKPRRYIIDTDPDNRVTARFEEVMRQLNVTREVKNFFYVSRCYGAAAIGIGTRDTPLSEPLPTFGLTVEDLFINVFDPLNAAGSMVTSQEPNSPNFQKPDKVLSISGTEWHPSRTEKVFHGSPVYLEYQASAFGFTGRSVFQSCLYPLKSYISTMVANNMVAKKAGVVVAKVSQEGTAASGIKGFVNKIRGRMVKEAVNESVITIGQNDNIESLNLQNLDGALEKARSNIIADIAAGADVPAQVIREEAFAQGFSDGKEDSKAVSQYIDGVRQDIEPVMDYLERVVMYVAWSETFYESLRAEYPDVITEDYQTTFYRWRDEFRAEWQELVEESPDKRRESDKAVVDGAIQLFNAIAPHLDPENKATAITWLNEVANATKTYEDTPLALDEEGIADYEPPPSGFDSDGLGVREPLSGLESQGVARLDEHRRSARVRKKPKGG